MRSKSHHGDWEMPSTLRRTKVLRVDGLGHVPRFATSKGDMCWCIEFICIYIYIPRTQMTLVLIGKDLLFEG